MPIPSDPRPQLIRIASTARAACEAHARQARPREACGILMGRIQQTAGGEPTVDLSHYEPVRNLHPNSAGFQMDPIGIAQADRRARDRNLRVLAVFHSHPSTPPEPSVADLQGAWLELVQLIWGERPLRGATLTAWLPAPDGWDPLPLAGL